MGSGQSSKPKPLPKIPGPSREFSKKPVYEKTDSDGFCRRVYVMYHATSRENALNILKKGFKPSTQGLLGPGLYLSRDINKTKSYGQVCFKVLAYTGKTKKVDNADQRWQEAYDSAYLPPFNNVVASGKEETCVKSIRQVRILGIAFGHHRLDQQVNVRNLEGTTEVMDVEEKNELSKLLWDLKYPTELKEVVAAVLSVIWAFAVMIDIPFAVFLERTVSSPVSWVLVLVVEVLNPTSKGCILLGTWVVWILSPLLWVISFIWWLISSVAICLLWLVTWVTWLLNPIFEVISMIFSATISNILWASTRGLTLVLSQAVKFHVSLAIVESLLYLYWKKPNCVRGNVWAGFVVGSGLGIGLGFGVGLFLGLSMGLV